MATAKRMERAAAFVRIWQESKTMEEVAGRLEISEHRATARASYYRKHGVGLKKFPRTYQGMNYEALNLLCCAAPEAPEKKIWP